MTEGDKRFEVQTEYVLVPKAALAWLNGEAPAPDGKWFGECEDDATAPGRIFPRKYWWRTKFRELCGSAPVAQAGKVPDLLATTLSYSGLVITIDCNDIDVRDEIYDWLMQQASSGPSAPAQTRLDASLFNSMQEELTEGHLALDRLGAPREFDDGAGLIRELDIAERISEIPSSVPSAHRQCKNCKDPITDALHASGFCGMCREMGCAETSTHLGVPHE